MQLIFNGGLGAILLVDSTTYRTYSEEGCEMKSSATTKTTGATTSTTTTTSVMTTITTTDAKDERDDPSKEGCFGGYKIQRQGDRIR